MSDDLNQFHVISLAVFAIGFLWLMTIATVAMFREKPINAPPLVYAVVTILSGVFGAVGGGFWMAGTTVKAEGQYEGINVAIGGTGGAAVFLIIAAVFLYLNRRRVAQFRIVLNIPGSYTLVQAAKAIADCLKAQVAFGAIPMNHQSATVGELPIDAGSGLGAYQQLERHMSSRSIPIRVSHSQDLNTYRVDPA